MEGGRAGAALFEGVKFQLAGFDAAEKFKFNDLLCNNGAEEASFEECTHVIVSRLQSDDPVCAAARRDGKALVTKAWVTASHCANAIMDTSSVLYMPVRDPAGIPGCKSFCICLTGYQGQARREIMEMVEMMGSKFTKQLNMQLVTHLICYKFEGPKYEAAYRCKIKMVNHRWLEDCLRHWCLVDESKYTTMSGYEIEELESQLNDSQDGQPAARTPEVEAELPDTKPSTNHVKSTGNGSRRSLIADHTAGNKNLASEAVKGTTSRINGRHGKRHVEDTITVECVVEEVRASEFQATTPRMNGKIHVEDTAGVDCVVEEVRTRELQAAVKATTRKMNGRHGKRHAESDTVVDCVVQEVQPSETRAVLRKRHAEDTTAGDSVVQEVQASAVVKATTPMMKGEHGKRHEEDTTVVDCAEVGANEFTNQAALLTQGTKDNEIELKPRKQLALTEPSKRSTELATEARQSLVTSDENHVKELQEDHFVTTEASGREKDSCIEPIPQPAVGEGEPSIAAMKDNGDGSCFSMRKTPADADSVSGKDKLPSSCSPKNQTPISDKAPVERGSSSSKKRKSSVGGSEEANVTSSKKPKDDDNIQSSSGVVTDGTGGSVGVRVATPMDENQSPTKSAANKEIMVVDLSDDSREDNCKRKPKSSKHQAKARGESKRDSKRVKVQKKPAAGKYSRSTTKRWFAIGGHRNEKQRYLKIIRELGGECRESHIWKEQTTHNVMPLRRTEKVFAAVAAGRWILKPEYLEASEKAGFFVNEAAYEYSGPGCNQENTIELNAPRHWRELKLLTGSGAFQGMTVIVYGECKIPTLESLKRAIKAGGGCVLAAHPPYHCYLARGIDYAVCGSGIPEDDHWIVQFRKHRVACVRDEYMVDFVCKPSSSLEKHILYGTGKAEAAARARLEQIKAEMKQQEEEEDFPCTVCKKRDSEELMLLCGDGEKQGCNIAMHTFCCDPPMDMVPEGDWYCNRCSQVVVCC